MTIFGRIFKSSILAAGFICSLGMPLSSIAQSVTVASNNADFSEEKPDFLHIREVVLTRKSKMSYSVDITLAAPVPNNIKIDEVYFYIGFDIDSNASTGRTTVVNSGFGQDIGGYVIKKEGTNRFVPDDGTATFKGQNEIMKVTNAKVEGNKVTFDLRCPLFGEYDSFKFFVCSNATQIKNGVKQSSIQVDAIKNASASFGKVN